MSTPDTSQTSSTVRTVAPIQVNVLCRLLSEYSERLNQKINAFQNVSHGSNAYGELLQDVQYLASQTEKLVSKASGLREHSLIDEGERFELELRLFDAEDALRSAKRIWPPQQSMNDLLRAAITKR